jgi:peptide/nickel transport system substrate-binding protein
VTAVPNIEGKPDLTLVPVESYRIFFNYMSSIQEHPSPLHDVRVRRALNHAIDKKLLIDTLFMGYAVPTKGQVLRKAQIGFNPDLDDFPYDPDKARELLKEAGYPDGFELTYKVSSGAYAQDSEIPFAIAGMLEKVGVKLKVEVLEGGEYLRQLRAQELQPMGFVGMAPPNDPGIMLSIFHSNWRYPYYKNAELDKLVDEGARELDKEKRAALYRKAVQIMYDDAAVLFLYGAVDFYATNAKIKNFKPGGDGKFWLYGVSAEE